MAKRAKLKAGEIGLGRVLRRGMRIVPVPPVLRNVRNHLVLTLCLERSGSAGVRKV